MFKTFDDFKEAYENTIDAIAELKSKAQAMIDDLESIVNACDTIEYSL